MWIDTHCHLDADEYEADRDAVIERARAAGIRQIVMPAGHIDDAETLRGLAHRHGFVYALGLHPHAIARSADEDLDRLRERAWQLRDDPRFVAIGEIGIDLVDGGDVMRQERFYREQLRIARDCGLPVIVHVRRSADLLLKHLRRIDVAGGIVHAWNGSAQQAQQLIERGFRLGIGGAATYSGSRRIRRFAAELPEAALVLETDAPYIPPQWLRPAGIAQRNEPAELARIAAEVAGLRGVPLAHLAACNARNACAALPRLAALG